MRAVVQRVTQARVIVAGEVVGEIGPGLCVLLGIARDDEASDVERLAGQIARLRIFENEDGKFDRSLVDTGGAALVVSQFTLIADTTQGQPPELRRRSRPPRSPSGSTSASAPRSGRSASRSRRASSARGWQVELVNDGPVTIVLG